MNTTTTTTDRGHDLGGRRRPPIVMRGSPDLLLSWVAARQAAGDLHTAPPRPRRLNRHEWLLTVPASYLRPSFYDLCRSTRRLGGPVPWWRRRPRLATAGVVAVIVAALLAAAVFTDTGRDLARMVGTALLLSVIVTAGVASLACELRAGRR